MPICFPSAEIEPNAQSTKRIALYLPSLRGGGAEHVMVKLANAFAGWGYPVDLVLASAQGPYLKEVSPRVQLVNLKARRVAASLPPLVRYLRKRKPIAMLSAMGHANVIAVLARRLACVPTRLIVSEHNNFSASKANAATFRERSMGHLMKWAYPHADGVVAVSCGVAEDLSQSLGLPRSAISVIHNPVIDELFHRLSRQVPEHSWFTSDESPIIVAMGRLVEQKDFSTLINAFAHLRQTRKAKLLILGEGKLRAQLTAYIEEYGLENDVDLPGFAANPFPLLGRASLFVLSSRWEGFANVLVQAMACGTPVVSTDCPYGPAEILENGRWGRLVPVGDAQALAEAMAAALEDKNPPDVRARAAEFTVDRAAEQYLSVMLSN